MKVTKTTFRFLNRHTWGNCNYTWKEENENAKQIEWDQKVSKWSPKYPDEMSSLTSEEVYTDVNTIKLQKCVLVSKYKSVS